MADQKDDMDETIPVEEFESALQALHRGDPGPLNRLIPEDDEGPGMGTVLHFFKELLHERAESSRRHAPRDPDHRS